MLIYSSTTAHKLDTKGRVSVPASYRNLAEQVTDSRAFFITFSLKRKCLVGYDVREVSRIREKFEAASDASPELQELDDDQELFFGLGAYLEFDKNGRINLPLELRELAEIDDECVFVGRGGFFEIRAPQMHKRVRDAAIARKLAGKGA